MEMAWWQVDYQRTVGGYDYLMVMTVLMWVERALRGMRDVLEVWALSESLPSPRDGGMEDGVESRVGSLHLSFEYPPELYKLTSSLDSTSALPDLIFRSRPSRGWKYFESINDISEWCACRWSYLIVSR